jgi:alpha-L-fucosidase
MATSVGSQGCPVPGVLPDVKLFNPTQLNTDQWLQSITALGAKYAVLVAKHMCVTRIVHHTNHGAGDVIWLPQ